MSDELVPIERPYPWGEVQHYACPVPGCRFLAIDPKARCPYHNEADVIDLAAERRRRCGPRLGDEAA